MTALGDMSSKNRIYRLMNQSEAYVCLIKIVLYILHIVIDINYSSGPVSATVVVHFFFLCIVMVCTRNQNAIGFSSHARKLI